MKGVHLKGLAGTNPLGFLAALGVQTAFSTRDSQPRLGWTVGAVPHAVVDRDFPVARIAETAVETLRAWRAAPALNPTRSDGTEMGQGDELKLSREDSRSLIAQARNASGAARLVTALIAEGSVDGNGKAKPSDLYFTAGQQKFLDMARRLAAAVTVQDFVQALTGPWTYPSELPSFMWDTTDDRDYAHAASDPSKDRKRTNPGVECLALLGLSRHQVFCRRQGRGWRTLTPGCSGTWKRARYSWPLWRPLATLRAVDALLAHASGGPAGPAASGRSARRPGASRRRREQLLGWGVTAVLSSRIRRSGQGGYGTFAPSEVLWGDAL